MEIHCQMQKAQIRAHTHIHTGPQRETYTQVTYILSTTPPSLIFSLSLSLCFSLSLYLSLSLFISLSVSLFLSLSLSLPPPPPLSLSLSLSLSSLHISLLSGNMPTAYRSI